MSTPQPEALFRQSYTSIVQSLALVGGDLAAAEGEPPRKHSHRHG